MKIYDHLLHLQCGRHYYGSHMKPGTLLEDFYNQIYSSECHSI